MLQKSQFHNISIMDINKYFGYMDIILPILTQSTLSIISIMGKYAHYCSFQCLGRMNTIYFIGFAQNTAQVTYIYRQIAQQDKMSEQKLLSPTGSQLVNNFNDIKFQMEMKEDGRRVQYLKEQQRKRKSMMREQRDNDNDQFLPPFLTQRKQEEQRQNINEPIAYIQKYRAHDEHRLSIEEILQKYETDRDRGLTSEQANRRLRKYKRNIFHGQKKPSKILKFLRIMLSPFAILLCISAGLCFALYAILHNQLSNLILGIVILVIVLITGTLRYQLKTRDQDLQIDFNFIIPPSVKVLRDGRMINLLSEMLVPGDIVEIMCGQTISADIRIIQSWGLKVNDSALTGEARAFSRCAECTSDNILDSKNIILQETLCAEGRARGVVYATGNQTFMSQIKKTVKKPKKQTKSDIIKWSMEPFELRLSIFTGLLAIILLIIGFIVRLPATLHLTFLIGFILASAPQSMVFVIFVMLYVSAVRIARKKVLLKNLDTIETLARLTCICSDKTGTLTENKLRAAHLWYDDRIFRAENRQLFGVDHPYKFRLDDPGFRNMQEAAVNSTTAIFDQQLSPYKIKFIEQDHRLLQAQKQQKINKLKQEWKKQYAQIPYTQKRTIGDPTQSAVIKFYQPIEDIEVLRNKYPVAHNHEGQQCRLPFNSMNKYSFSIHHYETQNSHYCLFMKAAPERSWKFCKRVLKNGKQVDITEEKQQEWRRALNEFGKRGERVLGFSKYHLPKDEFPEGYNFNLNKSDSYLNNQTFVGMISMNDPPRKQVPDAVSRLRVAGLKVIMVTGDTPVVAAQIAKQCHIITQQTVNQIAQRKSISFEQAYKQSSAVVIHGDQITKILMQDQDLPQKHKHQKLQQFLKKQEIAFARTSSYQKINIVKSCKKMGQVVAVTGDGVGDSPALNCSDIGISMGISGTDVTKDVAHIILLTDDFCSIQQAIIESRRAIDNLRRAACYMLSSHIAQAMPFVCLVILQIPVPITTILVLYVSIWTDLFTAIAFISKQSEYDLMTRRPNTTNSKLTSMPLLCQSYGYIGWTQFWGALACYYMICNDFGFQPSDMQFKANIPIWVNQNINDVYNPTLSSFGNSIAQAAIENNVCPDISQFEIVDWLYLKHAKIDLRMAALKCSMIDDKVNIEQIFNWGTCHVQQISPHTNLPICYTTQAIKYAQSGYFYGLILTQIFNILVCTTNRRSLFNKGFNNGHLIIAGALQIISPVFIGYCLPFNVFGARDNIFMHFGTPAIPFGLMMLVLNESKNLINRNIDKSHWFARVTSW